MQGELLPFASPETVLAHCRQIERRVLAIAPELTEQQCMALLAELSLAGLMVDSIERQVWMTPEYRARQTLTPVIPIDKLRAAGPGWPAQPGPIFRWPKRTRPRRPRPVA
jgi:hypothetical protein